MSQWGEGGLDGALLSDGHIGDMKTWGRVLSFFCARLPFSLRLREVKFMTRGWMNSDGFLSRL